MNLYPHQKESIQKIRKAFSKSKRVFFVLPTGAGKTFIFSNIAKSAIEKGKRTWIICPRNELVWQSVSSLQTLDTEPSIICPGYQESESLLHVVSKDTWIRRKEKIKNKPDFIIVDEGHLATDRYISMIEEYPDAYFLFVSATPERLNGQDLTHLAPIKSLVYGPSIEWLIENHYLSKVKYLCPPISGIENIKTRGTEFDKEQLEEWLIEKKVYSKTIEAYRKHCDGKQSIVFCRDIKHAETVADKFNEAGYKFENIDGTMARKRIRSVIESVRNHELDGLTSCELVTYGLDVPNVKSIIMLRPTKSRALFYQMLGRGLRFTDKDDYCVVLDQVGNAVRNCDGKLPWQQPEWNYSGKAKRNDEKNVSIKYCPWNDFIPCVKPSCIGCEYNAEPDKPVDKWEEIEGELVPIIENKPLSERGLEDKQYFNNILQDIIINLRTENGTWNRNAVGRLVNHSKKICRKPLWCYFVAYGGEIRHIDKELLELICDSAGYKRGWITHAERFLQEKLR